MTETNLANRIKEVEGTFEEVEGTFVQNVPSEFYDEIANLLTFPPAKPTL